MATRDITVLDDLTATLEGVIKGFSKLPIETRQKMAYMVELCDLWDRSHLKWEDSSWFDYRELDEWFGRGGFEKINDELGVFEVTEGWGASAKQTGGYNKSSVSYTKGYKLTEVVQDAVDRYLDLSFRQRGETELRDLKGGLIKTLPESISSKVRHDKNKTAIWSKGQKPPKVVPVNMDNLIRLERYYLTLVEEQGDLFAEEGRTAKDLHYNLRELKKLLRRANTKPAGRGNLPQHYQEHRTGRIYAVGVNLQTAPRDVRNAALEGHWDYDIDNCHYTLFTQLAARYGYEAKAINHYLDNKESVREELAKEIGLTRRQVKTCLLAILYGARTNTSHRSAIPKEIAKPSRYVTEEHKAKAERLYEHPIFKELYKDIGKGRRVILESLGCNRKGFLENAFGKGIRVQKSKDGKKKPATKEQQLAHLLQGIEAKALYTVVQEISDNLLLLLMHDGFITRERIRKHDLSKLSKKISEATGYKLSLLEKRVVV